MKENNKILHNRKREGYITENNIRSFITGKINERNPKKREGKGKKRSQNSSTWKVGKRKWEKNQYHTKNEAEEKYGVVAVVDCYRVFQGGIGGDLFASLCTARLFVTE